MNDQILFSVTRRGMRRFAIVIAILAVVLTGQQLVAQKSQDDYGDKFKVATDDGGIAIATSSDGKYVYIAGKRGLLVSDDYGKTGTWTQTLRMK